jgi:hypothetical protein
LPEASVEEPAMGTSSSLSPETMALETNRDRDIKNNDLFLFYSTYVSYLLISLDMSRIYAIFVFERLFEDVGEITLGHEIRRHFIPMFYTTR